MSSMEQTTEYPLQPGHRVEHVHHNIGGMRLDWTEYVVREQHTGRVVGAGLTANAAKRRAATR